MTDAVVTPLRPGSDQPKPKLAAWKPSKAVSINFLGGAGNETSAPIEKQRFGLVDLSFPTGTAILSFLGAHTVDGVYRLVDFTLDTAAVNTGGTAKLAGYGFFRVKQSVAEIKVVEAGMI